MTKPTDRERVAWLDWFVQGDDKITLFEEDGGFIMRCTGTESNTYIAPSFREALDEAMRDIPAPL